MKLTTIVGARPQFIKAATISRAIAQHNARVSSDPQLTYNNSLITEKIIHTGQHYDANMSKIFFKELDIPRPDYNLGVHEARHGVMTGKMLSGIEEILLTENPDWVLVYGDTNTTLAGALAGVKLHIPVAHVEAGLRSFNRKMPEEINRVLTDHAADLLFTPTDRASKNLIQEGIAESRVQQTGDVMYDASLFYAQKAKRPDFFDDLAVDERNGFLLATIHRAENTDNPVRLKNIFQGLSALPFPVILPLHPRTRKQINDKHSSLIAHSSSGITFVDPVGYLEMVWLEQNAKVIVTDSGGVQKEAYFYGVPCVTVREETEWVELVDAGWNRLAPPLSSDVAQVVSDAIGSKGKDCQLYGNGDAAEKILENLVLQICTDNY